MDFIWKVFGYLVFVCLGLCMCQARVDELPAKQAAVDSLNSRQKQFALPADKQKDIRNINARWAEVSFLFPAANLTAQVVVAYRMVERHQSQLSVCLFYFF